MSNSLSLRLSLFLFAGLIFLYAPIVVLIGYSFNFSDRVTVWAGFSTRWYSALLGNRGILTAASISLQIGFLSALLSVLLGTMAACVLHRLNFFRGRLLFAGLLAIPLVIPEIVLGLALLLLFVMLNNWLGWPGSGGLVTIVIAHTTLSIAYVTVILQARLAVIDHSIEEAALDLGARPWTVFVTITLPQLIPALVAGFMLAFVLSFDDLILASFVSGPGWSTLPMVVYSSVRLGLSPEINALATILLLLSLAIVSVFWFLIFRRV